MKVSSVLFTNYKEREHNYNSQKKQNLDINSLFKQAVEDAYDFSEKEKEQLDESIAAKIKSGEKLTPKELSYLQKKDPVLYLKVLMIQKKKEILENKLKNCKSKTEVNDVINSELGIISDKDPDREMKINAIQNTAQEFKQSPYYEQLPETDMKS